MTYLKYSTLHLSNCIWKNCICIFYFISSRFIIMLCGYTQFRKDFCCGYPSCSYRCLNTNWNNFDPLKKVVRNDFRIFSAKCEHMKRNKEVRKVKVFQQKLYFFFCPIKIIFSSAILIILGIVAICFPCSWHHVTCFWTALTISFLSHLGN